MAIARKLDCVPIARSCFRCGKEFHSTETERVCASCRKPVDGKRPIARALSFREEQVVELVGQAKLNKEIAYELRLTEGTIKEYLHRIFRKLEVGNRTELAIWAFQRKDAA